MKNIYLLISNDALAQAVFGKALFDLSPNCLCCLAANGIEAIDLMTKSKIVPDYIFVEYDMPYMNGIEFIKQIRQVEAVSHVPVMVHYTSNDERTKNSIKEAGALAIFQKEYDYYAVQNILSLYCFSVTGPLAQN